MSKVISIRFTPEEHRLLQDVCVSHGLPNVSELVRRALYLMLSASIPTTLKPTQYQHELLRLSVNVREVVEELARTGVAEGHNHHRGDS